MSERRGDNLDCFLAEAHSIMQEAELVVNALPNVDPFAAEQSLRKLATDSLFSMVSIPKICPPTRWPSSLISSTIHCPSCKGSWILSKANQLIIIKLTQHPWVDGGGLETR
jgi:hypothetical protein